MKRKLTKLAVPRETIRILGEANLGRVDGGQETTITDMKANCWTPAAAATGRD